MNRRMMSSILAGATPAPRASRIGKRAPLASIFVALAAVACGASPDAGGGPNERVSTSSAALNPEQVITPTNYIFQIDGVDKLYENDNKYGGGYVDWAALGVRVNETDPTIVGCTLGKAPANNTTLGICQDGAFTEGALLSRFVTVNSEADQVKVAIVLDDVENSSASAAGLSTQQGLASLGDGLAGVGSVVALGSPIVGAIIAVVGAGLSVAGDLLGPDPHDEITCAGGLIQTATPPWAAVISSFGWDFYYPNKPQDTMYLTFSAAELEQITASGPAKLTFPVSVVWPETIAGADPNTCNSAHNIHLSITRDWGSGLAPSPKAGDSAAVRTATELDWFQTDPSTSSLLRRTRSQTSWNSVDVTTASEFALPSLTSPVASLSRTQTTLDAFFVDQTGKLVWWNDTYSVSTIDPVATSIVGGLPSYAHLTAAGREPGMFDVFLLDGNGAVAQSHWPNYFFGATYMSNPAEISPTGLAPAGAGIAAVARSANNLDVFFVGDDGAVYTSYWYQGATAWTTFALSDPGLARPGALITAAARTTNNIDLFFIGANGAVYTSYWYNGAPSWSTFQLGEANEAYSGGAVSVVSRQPGVLDVAYVGNTSGYWSARVREWNGNWQPPVLVSASTGQDVSPTDDISIVASSAWNMDVLYRGIFGDSFDATFDYSDVSWRSVGVP
jgi:hypothetical protein